MLIQRDRAGIGANRPSVTGQGREFFAQVTMENGLIAKVR